MTVDIGLIYFVSSLIRAKQQRFLGAFFMKHRFFHQETKNLKKTLANYFHSATKCDRMRTNNQIYACSRISLYMRL